MIRLSSLTLRHGPEPLIEEADATVYPGNKVGLIGPNGCGKTSLFNLLLGRLSADAGEVEIPDDWVIGHMAQEIGDLDRPLIEYVTDGDKALRRAQAEVTRAEASGDGHAIATAHGHMEQADGYTARARAASLLAGLGFASETEDQPLKAFSGGWRIRASLAQALMCPSDLLLLDEPTNHLDMETVVWLEEWLKRYEGTLILISHDRDFIDTVVDSVIHIEHRKLNTYTGGYTDFERQRAEALMLQQAQFEKQQRQIAHMQKFIDRFRAKASKAKAAQSRIKAMERMEKLAPAHADSPFDFSFRDPPRAGNPLVSLEDVDLGYGETVVLSDLSRSLAPGDRIGLLGLNGAGKSTLVRALAGELDPMAGTIQSSRGLAIGYFAQHQLEQLHPASSPLDHLRWLAPDEPEQPLRDFLGGFAFHGDMAVNPVAPLSGGEKARLVLALLVWNRPNLLLLDEPTNHLDLDMRHALTVALQTFEGAVVIVSHDRYLLNNTVESYWLVADGGLSAFKGDLSDYRRWLAEQQNPRQAERSAGDGEEPARKSRKDIRRAEAEQRARLKPLYDRVKKALAGLEQVNEKLAALEVELARPELYEAEEKARLQALLAEQSEYRKSQQALEDEWAEAEQALEEAQDSCP